MTDAVAARDIAPAHPGQDLGTQLRAWRQREIYFRSRDGFLDPREGQDIQHRLERLDAMMHEAHEDGHDAQDDWDDRRRDDGRYYPRR